MIILKHRAGIIILVSFAVITSAIVLSHIKQDGQRGVSAVTDPGEKKNHEPDREKINNIIRYRYGFCQAYGRLQDLLKDYEDSGEFLTLFNDSDNMVKIDEPGLFYTLERIKQEIAISGKDRPSDAVEKIYDFIRRKRTHTYPLYENIELHDPVRFFSTYGSGFCDDAASNLVYLARSYGFDARTWWLNGHVVAEVEYDGNWHIYDPDALGIIYRDGKVAGMQDMVNLAQEDKLPDYNKEYRTTEDNRIGNDSLFLSQVIDNPSVEMFPGEKRRFYDRVFMLTTDAHHLKDGLNDPDRFLKEYQGNMANFIREIPINEKTTKEGVIIVEDYFPIAGVFLVLDGPKKDISREMMPQILLDSAAVDTVIWLPATIYADEGLKGLYLDMSFGVKNLEPYPSYRAVVRNLSNIIRDFDSPKLITAHYYCYSNARFDGSIDEEMNSAGLKVIRR